MNYEYIIFDLDGTISNPKQGILRCINFALEHFGYDRIDAPQVDRFIGPPLDQTFSFLTRSTDQILINSLVSKYREHYADQGYRENKLYDGITETLQLLSQNKHCTLGLCTSKRVDFAEKILTMFGLRELFSFVNGGDIGINKWQQLQQLLNAGTINSNSIMIGDRDIDLYAAHKNQLTSAAVLWGYGSLSELKNETPKYIFNHPHQLAELIS